LLQNNVLLDYSLISILGFLVFGPQLLIGLAAAEFVDKSLACTANGFAGWFAYLGAACAGYPLGKVIDIWNWDGFFIVLIVCSVAAYGVLLPIASKKPKSDPIQKSEKKLRTA